MQPNWQNVKTFTKNPNTNPTNTLNEIFNPENNPNIEHYILCGAITDGEPFTWHDINVQNWTNIPPSFPNLDNFLYNNCPDLTHKEYIKLLSTKDLIKIGTAEHQEYWENGQVTYYYVHIHELLGRMFEMGLICLMQPNP